MLGISYIYGNVWRGMWHTMAHPLKFLVSGVTNTAEFIIAFQGRKAKGEGHQASQSADKKHAVASFVAVRCSSRSRLLRLPLDIRMTYLVLTAVKFAACNNQYATGANL